MKTFKDPSEYENRKQQLAGCVFVDVGGCPIDGREKWQRRKRTALLRTD